MVKLARRLFPVLVVLAMVAGAVVTYQTKEDSIRTAAEIRSIRSAIEEERIALSLLKAEWSTLIQPERLQSIAERHPETLNLAAYGIDRMLRISDLPMAPVPVAAAGGAR